MQAPETVQQDEVYVNQECSNQELIEDDVHKKIIVLDEEDELKACSTINIPKRTPSNPSNISNEEELGSSSAGSKNESLYQNAAQISNSEAKSKQGLKYQDLIYLMLRDFVKESKSPLQLAAADCLYAKGGNIGKDFLLTCREGPSETLNEFFSKFEVFADEHSLEYRFPEREPTNESRRLEIIIGEIKINFNNDARQELFRDHLGITKNKKKKEATLLASDYSEKEKEFDESNSSMTPSSEKEEESSNNMFQCDSVPDQAQESSSSVSNYHDIEEHRIPIIDNILMKEHSFFEKKENEAIISSPVAALCSRALNYSCSDNKEVVKDSETKFIKIFEIPCGKEPRASSENSL